MSQRVRLFSLKGDALPESAYRELVDGMKPKKRKAEQGLRHVYRWEDLIITVTEMSLFERIRHSVIMEGYIHFLYAGKVPKPEREIQKRFAQTQLLVEVVLDPGEDRSGRCKRLLRQLIDRLDPIIDYGSDIYDRDFKLLIDADRTPNRRVRPDEADS